MLKITVFVTFYFCFFFRLGQHAFSRAYINFLISEDIFIFTDKFDGYVFLDSKGNSKIYFTIWI